MTGIHCIVTGGRRGIGAACVDLLVKQGNNVSVFDLFDQDIESENLLKYSVDVTSEEGLACKLTRAIQRFGNPKVLINCAGITQVPTATKDCWLSDWERVVDINLKGTFIACKTVGAAMLDGGGSIVNVASICGEGGFTKRNAYGPSKAAVKNLTETLAVEWGASGIRVNAVSPGYVATEMVQTMINGGAFTPDMVVGRTPLGRLAEPKEVAQAIIFLCSDDASYITGATLAVDGGWLANRGP